MTNGFSGSFGIAFLLQVIPARSSASCATLPVTPNGRRSTSIRWLSVPPDTMRKPSSAERRRRAPRALRDDLRRRTRGTRAAAASRNATAFAAMTCISGPPCSPGNTALSIAAAYCSRHRIAPARGPAQRLVGGEGDDVGVRARATGARRRR